MDLQRGGFSQQEFVIGHRGPSQGELPAAQPLLLLRKALSLLGLPSACRDPACLGEPPAFEDIPGEEGLAGKGFSREPRGCSDLLCRTPGRGLPAPPSAKWLCLFQSQPRLSSELHSQPAECGNSDRMTWELGLKSKS